MDGWIREPKLVANSWIKIRPGFEDRRIFAVERNSYRHKFGTGYNPPGDNVELFQLFRRGRQLVVYAAGQIFEFNLTDTGRVLRAVLDCANSYVNPAPIRDTSINPFVVSPRPSASSSPASSKETSDSKSDNRAEAVTLLANVLAQSGITDFYVFPPNEMPKDVKADVVWKTSDVIGTFTVSPSMKLDDLAGTLIGGDAQTCKGKYASGSIPDETGVVRIFTACDMGKKSTTVYYIGIPRNKGGIYLMATADFDASGQSQAAKKADENLRSAAMKVLYQPK